MHVCSVLMIVHTFRLYQFSKLNICNKIYIIYLKLNISNLPLNFTSISFILMAMAMAVIIEMSHCNRTMLQSGATWSHV